MPRKLDPTKAATCSMPRPRMTSTMKSPPLEDCVGSSASAGAPRSTSRLGAGGMLLVAGGGAAPCAFAASGAASAPAPASVAAFRKPRRQTPVLSLFFVIIFSPKPGGFSPKPGGFSPKPGGVIAAAIFRRSFVAVNRMSPLVGAAQPHAGADGGDQGAGQKPHIERHRPPPDIEQQHAAQATAAIPHLVEISVVPEEPLAIADAMFLAGDLQEGSRPAIRQFRYREPQIETNHPAKGTAMRRHMLSRLHEGERRR